jgi:ABC-type Na+ efflux pump permease subunit
MSAVTVGGAPVTRRRRSRSRAWTIARTDLRQLRQARDFWLPLAIISSMFFVIIPGLLLVLITHVHDVKLAKQLGDIVGALPKSLRAHVHGPPGPAQASYALAVNLFAPLAIVVPLTVSSAVGANTIIGERERGSGEFLAHSPASEREIYVGKLLAALIPGYLTAFVGFGIYSVIVNLTVGPQVGGWFFPTGNWWLLMAWVLPPFIALALCLILAISARVSSAAAAQQASALVTLPLIVVAYSVASGSLVDSKTLGLAIGALAWLLALAALFRASRSLSRERLLGMGA